MGKGMMGRCLLKVVDTFAIPGRGVAMAPGIVLIEGEKVRIGDPLMLIRPDGTRLMSVIGGLEFFNPNPRSEIGIFLKDLTKEDVPIGTEVWLTLDDNG